MAKSIKRSHKKLSRKKKINKWAALPQKYLVLGLGIVVFLTFTPILWGEFFNFDDKLYVSDNPYLKYFSLKNIAFIFTEFYENQYSPIAMLFIALEHLFFGDSTWAFKLVSILWHVANSILVFYTIRLLTKKNLLAFVTALLFGISTMQVESVAWMAASFKTGPFVFFSLVAIIFYVRYVNKKNKFHLLVSLFCFVLSCLSKEQAVTLSLAIVAVDYLLKRDLLSPAVLLEKVPYFAISALFGIVTLMTHSDFQTADFVFNFSLFERIVFTNYSLGAYVINLLLPYDVSNWHTYPLQGNIPVYYYLFLLSPLILIILIWWAHKKSRVIAFGLLFFILNLSVTLVTQIQAVRQTEYADRYVYLASVGVFLVIAVIFDILSKKYRISLKSQLLILGSYCLIIASVSFLRCKNAYLNDELFFSDIIQKEKYSNNKLNPFLAHSYSNRGLARKQKGDINGALKDYEESIKSNSSYAIAYTNRANIYFDRKEYDIALSNYNKAISIDQEAESAYSGRGAIHIMQGNRSQGMADLNKAIELKDDFKDAYKNRGIAYYMVNEYELALRDFQKYLEYDPDNYNILNSVGLCYAGLSQFDKAIQAYNKCIAAEPGQRLFYGNRALSYRGLGQHELAAADEATVARMSK